MKVCLAPRYLLWMWILLPTTCGAGTALLWMLSLGWPRAVEAETLTLRGGLLRGRRSIRWGEIAAIKVRCDYIDGRVTRIDIEHARGRSSIAVNALRNGQVVAATILANFKRARRARSAPSLPIPDVPRHSASLDTRVRSSAA
jgi:hypothetical protein